MDYPIHWPASIDVLIYITDGDRKQGTATVSFKPGRDITKQDVRQAIADFERDDMPEGFRLMTTAAQAGAYQGKASGPLPSPNVPTREKPKPSGMGDWCAPP